LVVLGASVVEGMMTRDDLSLMRRLKAGDEQAMATLLAEHWTPVVRYAFGLLGSWDKAEDVAQDAFVRLWARRKGWSSGSAGALIYRMARNAALDVLKSPRHAGPREDPDMLASANTPERDVELSELELAVAQAIGDLPPRRREIFKLVRESGFSYLEIAEIMEISTQTVANHMSLALTDLRVRLRLFLPGTPEAEAPNQNRTTQYGEV
jgi:RNA polymerase sigma-70 factor (ECF subfamily)